MKTLALICVTCLLASVTWAAGTGDEDAGKKAEQRSCLPCHSLRLIETQRLSAAAWQKEVDKMVGWGAMVPDKQVLVDYLSRQYSNAQPPPTTVLSGNSQP